MSEDITLCAKPAAVSGHAYQVRQLVQSDFGALKSTVVTSVAHSFAAGCT